MQAGKVLGAAAVMAAALAASGCSSIRESRGYIQDPTLVAAVQPGIDNQQSVAATLGRPSFTSQFGDPTWYYVSSITGRRPFVSPSIKEHSVLAVKFDAAGNVVWSASGLSLSTSNPAPIDRIGASPCSL